MLFMHCFSSSGLGHKFLSRFLFWWLGWLAGGGGERFNFWERPCLRYLLLFRIGGALKAAEGEYPDLIRMVFVLIDQHIGFARVG